MVDSDSLARLALFADLAAAQLDAVANLLEDERYPRGTRVMRQGLSGNSFYVILEGDVAVSIDGEQRAQLRPGEFFGEISILTGEPVQADVVVMNEELRCAVLSGPELKPLLLRHPSVAVRMLEFGARRLRAANLWGR
jgi:trk system potassium uptake protein TrkA